MIPNTLKHRIKYYEELIELYQNSDPDQPELKEERRREIKNCKEEIRKLKKQIKQ